MIYFDCQPIGGAKCCFRNNVLSLLRERNYKVYTSRGRYLKVDNIEKTCFGSQVKDTGDVFDDRDSWKSIRDAL